MKRLIFLLFIGLTVRGFAQCDTNKIVLTGSILSVSSETGDSAKFAFDLDPNTFWVTDNASVQELIYGFGKTVNLNGVYADLRYANRSKPDELQIYTSDNGQDWELQYRSGDLFIVSDQNFEITFGTVGAQYVKVIFATQTQIEIAEMGFMEDSCVAVGHFNPIIDFEAIDNYYTQVNFIDLVATEKDLLPVLFSVVEGGVSLKDKQIITNGYKGKVTIAAKVIGGASHYNAVVFRTFTLYDQADYKPEAWMSITDEFPLELKTWEAYPIYMRAEMNDVLGLHSIDSVALYIEGTQVTYSQDGAQGFYSYHLWYPKEYRTYEIKMVAEASNGESFTITRNVEIVKGAESQQVTTLDDVVIWFGKENSRSYQSTYNLPQYVGVYDKITANLKVECPDGNCDDWDRWAYIDVMGPDGNWIQIIRYITPYGVGCDHSIDLSQYASLLQGNVPMRVFIDTWGTGGWQLTLTLDYQAGEPEYLYSNVVEIWDGSYDFGNPANLQPVEEYEYELTEGVEEAWLYLSTTGHGWGENNSYNAAEFFQAGHHIEFNGDKIYQQDLWNNCNPNPDGCSGQKGSWQYNRAGWCPGAISPPDIYDLKDVVEGSSFKLKYRFHETYVDDCHPNNAKCISGRTCKNCNDGYNPHYQIDAHAISYSNQVLIYNNRIFQGTPEKFKESLVFNVFPNPSNESFKLSGFETNDNFKMTIRSTDGRTHAFYYFKNSDEAFSASFDIKSLNAGMYFIQIEGKEYSGYQSLIVE